MKFVSNENTNKSKIHYQIFIQYQSPVPQLEAHTPSEMYSMNVNKKTLFEKQNDEKIATTIPIVVTELSVYHFRSS